VVELRIFEGEAKNDITFSYNANFFLFATLETARPIIHGRVQPSPQQIPVLTGMPVSGMAYLDRPSEAGYFIFPDLSVRHEGRYRLSFNLYEETKDEKDADAEQPPENPPKPSLIGATPNGSFDWRLEVKSAVFTVYSAKKFPGLAESTILSRTVAEQGCRVRIRRDVRMRRREGKTAGDYEEFDDEYARARRTGTPESVHESYVRQRSLSNTPSDRQPYCPEPPGSTRYLNFGIPASQPQFSQPAPPQPLPAQQSYQPPPPPYGPSSTANYPERQPYPAQYAAPRENYETGYRRTSATYNPPAPSLAAGQYPTVDQNYNRNPPISSYQQYQTRPHSPGHVSLAPLKMPPALEPKYESSSSSAGPLAAAGRIAPSLPSPGYQDRPAPLRRQSGGDYSQQAYSANYAPSPAASQYGPYPTPTSAPVETPRSGKRPFDSVFNSSSLSQPLHNGMRPTSSHHAQGAAALDDDDDVGSLEALRMQYKRADGTSYSRELPTLE
jgi:hypothetical protein